MTDEEGDVLQELRNNAEGGVTKANNIHTRLSEMREWSFRKSVELQTRANLLFELNMITEDQRDEVIEQARRVETVYRRLDING